MNNSSKSSAKFAAYILGKLLAVLLSVLVIVLAFLIAMNTMNIRVTVKDAFTIRDSVMLIQTDNDNKELIDKVFSSNYIEKSGILNLSDNKAYNVTNYNQDTDVTFKLIWPWQTKATITVSDVVDDVRATLVSDTVDESQLKENYLIESGKYNVKLVKTKNGWIVTDIELLETIEPEVAFPLPTPSKPNDDNSVDESTEGQADETETGENE